MKILKVLLVLFILIVSVVPAQCDLFTSKSVNKANDFIAAGMTKEAIQTLKNGILEDPKDHEAHWMLGKMYLEGGYYSGAEERFNSAILLKPDLKDQLGDIYKNVADLELSKGNAQQSIKLFEIALKYKTYDRSFYLNAGDRLSGMQAAQAYQKAAMASELKDKAGKKILMLAVNDKYNQEAFKKMGADILGEDFVRNVFPGPQNKIVFETVVTDKDINLKTEEIDILYNCKILKNDIFELVATIDGQQIFNAKEVKLWRGEHFKEQWYISKDGKHQHDIETNSPKGQTIWIEPGKNIKAHVRVLREITPEANISLLNQ